MGGCHGFAHREREVISSAVADGSHVNLSVRRFGEFPRQQFCKLVQFFRRDRFSKSQEQTNKDRCLDRDFACGFAGVKCSPCIHSNRKIERLAFAPFEKALTVVGHWANKSGVLQCLCEPLHLPGKKESKILHRQPVWQRERKKDNRRAKGEEKSRSKKLDDRLTLRALPRRRSGVLRRNWLSPYIRLHTRPEYPPIPLFFLLPGPFRPVPWRPAYRPGIWSDRA